MHVNKASRWPVRRDQPTVGHGELQLAAKKGVDSVLECSGTECRVFLPKRVSI